MSDIKLSVDGKIIPCKDISIPEPTQEFFREHLEKPLGIELEGLLGQPLDSELFKQRMEIALKDSLDNTLFESPVNDMKVYIVKDRNAFKDLHWKNNMWYIGEVDYNFPSRRIAKVFLKKNMRAVLSTLSLPLAAELKTVEIEGIVEL